MLIALALLPLLPPAVNGIAILAADAPYWLGVDDATALRWNERTVGELLTGDGDFVLGEPPDGPGYAADERHHLADAQVLLRLALGAGLAGATVLIVTIGRATAGAERTRRIRVAGRAAGATALVTGVVAVAAAVAFDPLFELFHRIAFPGGGWAFDPAVSRLIRLYPVAFWQQMTAALVVAIMTFGLAGFALSRILIRRSADG